ncbi:MAG: DUF3800 domain-containing protein [Deltaproteobacteria bacterium]|nr:DUF3800 domain-containing protein [Deltaproteobacteria bacterium]
MTHPVPHERPPRYRLYIDESGDHTYNDLEHPSRRYLALLGVWFKQVDEYVAFADDLERFKREMFGPRPDKPVVLHRSDIINRKGPFGILRMDAVREKFDAGLLEVVGRARFRMVCVVIDKQKHSEKNTSPFHPYHYCLAAMLDRFSGWLNYKNAVGDVMAESRGREEDRQLEQAYVRVYESGTLMFDHTRHQRALTSKDIKLRRKAANIAGLQLADVLAHPIKQVWSREASSLTSAKTSADRFTRPQRTSSTSTRHAGKWKGMEKCGYKMKRPLSGDIPRQPLRAVHLRAAALTTRYHNMPPSQVRFRYNQKRARGTGGAVS